MVTGTSRAFAIVTPASPTTDVNAPKPRIFAPSFSANLPALDDVLQSTVVRVFDHQHINHAIPEFAEGKLIPTSENIARYCWDRIRAALDPSMTLQRVRLREDETFFVDYTGDD